MQPIDQPAFEGTDRYIVRRHIGGGAMGLVYEAWDRDRKTPVAVKTIRADGSGLYRLKQEFRGLADLAHPNLVSLYELVGDERRWFIVMELVQGVDFLSWLRGEESARQSMASWHSQGMPEDTEDLPTLGPEHFNETPPEATLVDDLKRLRSAFVQLLRGLAALHAAGKLHRDLKPSNVLVNPDGRVVLIDFGLIYDVDRAASELSRVDRVVGTLAFMPPEQARGEPPTEAADLYAVGAMLYLALTGRLPFEGPLVQVLMDKQNTDPTPPSALVAGIPQELDHLCTELLSREPSGRPSAAEVLERLGEPLDPATALGVRASAHLLLGRDSEQQVLEEAWAAARSGKAGMMLVKGASGTGKTALVQHFLSEVRRHEEVFVLRGRCFERESVPFKAFDTFVDALRRRLERMEPELRHALLPADFGALVRVFPVLASLIDPLYESNDTSSTDVEPTEVQHRAFEALRVLLRNLTTLRPLIVFLDDTQWGDTDSALLLSALLRDLRECRLLFVVAWRTEDEEASPFLLHLLHDPSLATTRSSTLVLEDLAESTAKRVAWRLLANLDLPLDDTAGWVARESGGNPFLLNELCTSLRHASEHGEAVAPGSLRLEDLILRRVRALPEETRRLMQVVALASRPLPLKVVAAAAGLTQDALAPLSALRTWRLVRTTRGPLGDLVEPYQARIAEAVIGGLPPGSEGPLHLRLAQAMEGAGWHDPEELYLHFRAAGEVERAGLLAMEAARAASDTLAFSRAADLFGEALELRDWTPQERLTLEIEWADTLVYAGRGEQAARLYLDVAGDSEPGAALELRRKAGDQLLFCGRVEEGLEILRRVVTDAGVPVAPTAGWTMGITWFRRRLLANRDLQVPAVPEARVDAKLLRRIDVCWFASLGLGLVDPIQASWYHALGLRMCLEAGEPYRLARALSVEIAQGVAWGTATPERQALLIRRGRNLAAEAARPHANGLIALGEGVAAYQEGRWDPAIRALRRAVRTFSEQGAGSVFELTAARMYETKASTWAGQLGRAAEERRRLLHQAANLGNRFLGDGLHTDVSAWIDIGTGQATEGRAGLDRCLAHWDRSAWDQRRILILAGQIEYALFDDDPQTAWRLLQEAHPAVRAGRLHWLSINRRRIAEHTGRVALALAAKGDLSALGQARKASKVLHQTHMAGLAHLLDAGLAAQAQDALAVETSLSMAQQRFEQDQMHLHEAVARWRLAERLTGEQARRERATAEQWFRRENITEPQALVRMLAPGL